MRTFTYTIKDALGIHARPAALLVKKASEFESNILLNCDGKLVNLKKIIAVMAMEIKHKQTVTVFCEGPDQERAALELEKLFENNL